MGLVEDVAVLVSPTVASYKDNGVMPYSAFYDATYSHAYAVLGRRGVVDGMLGELFQNERIAELIGNVSAHFGFNTICGIQDDYLVFPGSYLPDKLSPQQSSDATAYVLLRDLLVETLNVHLSQHLASQHPSLPSGRRNRLEKRLLRTLTPGQRDAYRKRVEETLTKVAAEYAAADRESL